MSDGGRLKPNAGSESRMHALARLATRVGACRTLETVLAMASSGLQEVGLDSVLLQVEGGDVVIRAIAAEPVLVAAAERLLGSSLVGLRVPINNEVLQRVLNDRQCAYLDRVPEALARTAAWMTGGLTEIASPNPLDDARVVLVPIVVRDRPWGVLAASSPSLTEEDAATLTFFASQVASTIELIASLGELERTSGALAEVHAAEGVDPDRLLPRLARVAARATGSDLCALLLQEEEAGLALRALHGSQCLELAPPGAGGPRMPGIVEQVAATLTTQVRARFQLEDPPEWVDDEDLQHLAALPLTREGRLAGVVLLGRRDDQPYGQQERGLAEILARQLAIQIENARLYTDAQRRVRFLSVLFRLGRLGSKALEVRPLCLELADLLADAMAVDGVVTYLVDGARLVLTGWRGLGEWVEPPPELLAIPFDDTSVSGRACVHRQTVVVGQAQMPQRFAAIAQQHGAQHIVATPLVAHDAVLGSLLVVRRAGRAFTKEEVMLLEACAGQAAAAIEHVRHFEAARLRAEDLKLLLNVGRAITGSLEIDGILQEAADALARLIRASSCWMFQLDEERRELVGAATSNAAFLEHFRTVRISLDETSAAVTAVLERRAVTIGDTRASTKVHQQLVETYDAASLIAVPAMSRDQPIGCLVITDRSKREWTEPDVERATLVANQVGAALANARLYEDLKRSYAQLGHAQGELVRSERLAALGELAAVVAHEVRNPVAVVFNALSSLRRLLQPTGEVAMLLGIIGEEADRLNRMVGDFLDFARPAAPALESEALGAVIGDTMAAARNEPAAQAVQIRSEIAGDLPPVPLDARMLRQALLNVVLNGLQSMPRGGTLEVRAVSEQKDGRRWARVDVTDTGPGIPDDVVGKIFQPFFTTKASGTGLGLAVVKRIIDAHRGEVAIDTRAGQGTTVSLRIPIE